MHISEWKNKIQLQVKEFHERFEHPISDVPTIPDRDVLKLRCKLILEEALEFCRAAGFFVEITDTLEGEELTLINAVPHGRKPNLVDMADAIADINYVVAGSAIVCGLDQEKLGDEVHRSNMTKVWPDGTVHKDSMGKTLKPDTYSPANIKDLLCES